MVKLEKKTYKKIPRVSNPLALLGQGVASHDNGMQASDGGIVSLLTQVIVTDTRQIHVWEPLSFRPRRQHKLFTRKDIA